MTNREKVAKELYADAQQASRLLSEQVQKYSGTPEPLYYAFALPLPDWDTLEPLFQKIWLIRADQIRALIVDEDAELPKNPFDPPSNLFLAYKVAQQDMRAAGWRKVCQ